MILTFGQITVDVDLISFMMPIKGGYKIVLRDGGGKIETKDKSDIETIKAFQKSTDFLLNSVRRPHD